MSDLTASPLPSRCAKAPRRRVGPPVAAALLLGWTVAGCGAGEGRPAAHPDFRALQVSEARVAEHAAVAESEARECDERREAALRCDEEVARAKAGFAEVRDADASARIERLERQCAAARASLEGRCGQGD